MSAQVNTEKLNINVGHCSNQVFHALDVLVGVMIVVDAISLLFTGVSSFVGFILPIYFAVFGVLIIVFVFYALPQLYASVFFYFTFLGRGLTFLFIGSVIVTFGDDLSLATGIIAISIAFVYVFFSIWTKFCNLMCSLPVPLMQRSNGFPDQHVQSNKQTTNVRAQSDDDAPSNNTPLPQTKQSAPKTTNVDVTIQVNDPQQYGSAYNDDAKDPQFTPIIGNSNGPQLANNDAKALNDSIMESFGKDINSIPKQTVPGYSAPIPTVLVMLEQALHDGGGYNKHGIFHPDTIASNKDNDESYLISNNIISFFSELPSPLLSFVSPKVFDAGVNKDAMWRVLEKIPVEQGSIAQFVWDMLAKVAKYESKTNMNSEQLGRIFGPLMTMNKDQMTSDMLRASKMIVCWRRGIDWRMDKL
eukprot:81560_1